MATIDDETTGDSLPPGRPAGELPPGTLLNGIYRIEGRIGAGGMGEVYRATNIANDEQDAIKIIGRGRADQTLIEAMFRKEARVLSRIRTPAVAQLKLFARDTDLQLLYFVTDFVPGESLLDRLKRRPGSPAELRALLGRLLRGLQVVHEAGAVHRDLSTDNIILPDGDPAEAKIIDFGIAKELDPTHTTMVGDSLAGKLGYIAPEQLGFSGAQVGPWTDLYSLALVGVAFAAGKPLDMGATVGRAEEARRGPIDLTALPDDLRPLFARLLTYDWRERPQTAGDVLAMLEGQTSFALPAPATPAASVTAASPRAPAPPAGTGSRRLLIALALLVFALTAGVAALALLRPAGGTDSARALKPGPQPSAAVITPEPSPPLRQPAAAADPASCHEVLRIPFSPASAIPSRQGQERVATIAKRVSACRPATVRIIAGADEDEPGAYSLAEQRAFNIRMRLLSAGVASRQLDTGTGFSRLGPSDRKALGRNVRIELIAQ